MESSSSLRLTSAACLLALIVLTSAQAAADQATDLAERSMEAMGGRQAWEETRFLRFNFFGFRLHHWNRHTVRHRLEGKTREGDEYVVLHNIHTREGQVWLNGEELAGEDEAEWLKRAYGAWINDAYWLVMPYKLQDPGVNLSHDGEEELDGAVYDKLLLFFDGVGLTPGDRYWAYWTAGPTTSKTGRPTASPPPGSGSTGSATATSCCHPVG